MAKAEQSPPFKMKIENGHLVPVSAWDAERLATYRNGSEVSVIITQEVASWRRRKYWAILGNVVKTCPVRQRRAEDLHKAIRLKLGIVDSFTTLGGATKVELRSTSLMDEQEFEAFYHEAMDLLREQTGVDVETLGKEATDVGRDDNHEEQQVSDVPPTASDQGSGDSSSPVEDPAPTESAAADLQAPEEPSTPEESSGAGHTETPLEGSPDPLTRELMRECVDTFMSIATRTDAGIEAKRKQMANSLSAWRKEAIDRDFIEKCRDAAGRIVKKESTVEREREYLGRFIR